LLSRHDGHSEEDWSEDINYLRSVHSKLLCRIPSGRTGRGRQYAGRPTTDAGATSTPTRPIQPLRIPDEPLKVLPTRVVRVDGPNATLTAPPAIVKPERLVLVRLQDLYGQRRLCGSVDSVAEARVESIEGDIAVVSGDTGLGEGGFDCRVRAVGKIENNDVSDGCLDFLRFEDQAGVLVGTITADHDGDGFGRGKQNGESSDEEENRGHKSAHSVKFSSLMNAGEWYSG